MRFHIVLFIMIFKMAFMATGLFLISEGLDAKYIAFPLVAIYFAYLFYCVIKYEVIERWQKKKPNPNH